MPLTADSVVQLRPRSRLTRCLLALGIAAAATLLRFAADPVLHNQIPYFVYVAAVVVATWATGVAGGILATVVAAFAGNYFFVPPRYEFIPHGEDWAAMAMFSAVAVGLVWFVGRWRSAEIAVRELHVQTTAMFEQLRAATLAAEVGVWTWTPDDGRVSVGANWRSLFGAAPDDEVTFDTWRGALHPDDRERAVETLNAAWGDRHDFSTEYRVVRPDGTVRWIIDRGRAFSDAEGRLCGMTGINVDITERKAAEEALREANHVKDEFLATLSHELRTPLNAIVGWSDMLRRGTMQPETARRAIDAIYRNAKVQTELINDVLDVSRIISGKVRLDTQPVDPGAVLQNALESVRAAADAKALTVVADFAAVPGPVSGDATRLQQVFWNLLSNAVKFTPAGGRITVSLRLSGRDIEVSVADTGIGISADFLPHVFERFRQRDSSTTRTHGGLGLGLAIVRHLVELHGGTVDAESPGEGLGATFRVRLPVQPFEERRQAGRSAIRQVRAVHPVPDDVPNLCGARVLVVDDEDDAREVTAAVLRYHGAIVEVAADALQALRQFDSFGPNVLLVDLAMPGIDGFAFIETIRRTRRGQRGADVPAIAFAAYAREEDQRQALARGFQRHLAKPVDAHTLVRSVADTLRAGGGVTGGGGSSDSDAVQ